MALGRQSMDSALHVQVDAAIKITDRKLIFRRNQPKPSFCGTFRARLVRVSEMVAQELTWVSNDLREQGLATQVPGIGINDRF